jgi:hypothetical protein
MLFASALRLQHKRACRRLLKHLPMIDLGEVEVDSLLTHNTKILYKCSAVSVLWPAGLLLLLHHVPSRHVLARCMDVAAQLQRHQQPCVSLHQHAMGY